MPFNPFSSIAAKLSMGMNVALILVILGIGYTKNNEISGLNADKKTLITRVSEGAVALGRCQSSRVTLERSLDRQNASLAELGRTTATQAATGKAALAEARKGSTVIRERVVQIGTRQAGTDACKSANDLITESLK